MVASPTARLLRDAYSHPPIAIDTADPSAIAGTVTTTVPFDGKTDCDDDAGAVSASVPAARTVVVKCVGALL